MDLKSLNEEAYKIFSHYHIGKQLNVCKCKVCLLPDQETYLMNTPLRQIDFDYLLSYIYAVPLDEGNDTAEMGYFMPRVLEMISSGRLPEYGEDDLLQKFYDSKTGKFGGTPEEYHFLKTYFREFWKEFLERDFCQSDIITYYYVIAHYFDPQMLFDEWKEHGSEKRALLLFAEMVNSEIYAPIEDPITEKQYKKLTDWLDRKDTKDFFCEKLKEASANTADFNEEERATIQEANNLYYAWYAKR